MQYDSKFGEWTSGIRDTGLIANPSPTKKRSFRKNKLKNVSEKDLTFKLVSRKHPKTGEIMFEIE